MSEFERSKRIEEKIAASVFGVMLPLAVAAAAIGATVPVFLHGQHLRSVPPLCIAGFLALAWLANRRAKPRLAAHLMICSLSVAILVGMAINGGVTSNAYVASMLLIAGAAWLYGPRGAVAISVACIAAGGVFLVLGNLGLLYAPPPVAPALTWGTVGLCCLLMLCATAMPNRMLRQALDESEKKRAEAEEAYRHEKEALQALAERENALQAAVVKYKTLFGCFPLGITVTDETGKIRESNLTSQRLLGVASEEQIQRTIDGSEWRVIRPDGTPMPTGEFAGVRALKEKRTVDNVEMGIVKPDGAIAWINVTATPLPLPEHGVVITYGDITERKHREGHIALLGQMLDEAPASITIHDTQGRFLFANRKTFALHGYEENEFLATNLHDLDVPESEALLAERFRRIAEEGEATFDVAHYRKDGSTFPLQVLAKAIEWQGEPAVLSIAADITERKEAEAERDKLETQLRQAQKMESVGRLAGGVAHDFNNMLSVILGHAEIALDFADPAQPIHASLREIGKAAQRSAELTRQLLTFARKQTIAPKVLNLNETVTGLLNMLQRLIGENIDITWHPSPDPWTIKMDPSQIDQIMANLCVNARDAIADVGKITIETKNRTLDEEYCAAHAGYIPGEYVMLSVSDDGCGMDKEILAHIFEPFFTTKGVGEGTGLGLASVYGAVKQNNGFINVYSEPGQGTTFSVYLPRHGNEAEQMPAQKNKGKNTGGHETILLVEDELTVLKLTTMLLEMQGYTVLPASAPDEAIRLAREYQGEIHLLMSDVVMPSMNGRELAQTLLAVIPNIKRLFMSGYTANVIAHHGVLDKDVHFIEKPFSKDDLAVKVRAVLDSK